LVGILDFGFLGQCGSVKKIVVLQVLGYFQGLFSRVIFKRRLPLGFLNPTYVEVDF
jgi:hypothetical protein